MNRVALLVPYFGKLPDYFDVFLKSCSHNKKFDWIFFIDDTTEYDYPPNVKIHYRSFESLKSEFESKFEFPISLDKPYKLCDFRPSFGHVFSEYINCYEYWGHCDIDLVFGDLSKFVDDIILDNYEKIYFKGHFSLFKNDEKMNTLFKSKINGREYYKEVFSSPLSYGFDENGLGEGVGMYTILTSEKVNMYEEPDYASLNITKGHFQLSVYPYDPSDENKNKNSIFTWENGKLLRYFIRNEKVHSKEYMYVHMQARNMKVKTNNSDSYLIIPNEILPFNNQKITKDFLRINAKTKPIYFYFWKRRVNRLIKKIL